MTQNILFDMPQEILSKIYYYDNTYEKIFNKLVLPSILIASWKMFHRKILKIDCIERYALEFVLSRMGDNSYDDKILKKKKENLITDFYHDEWDFRKNWYFNDFNEIEIVKFSGYDSIYYENLEDIQDYGEFLRKKNHYYKSFYIGKIMKKKHYWYKYVLGINEEKYYEDKKSGTFVIVGNYSIWH